MNEVRLRIRPGECLVGREPYASAAVTLLQESGCIVVKWREKMTGGAYTTAREWNIEVPEPRGPVSYATLAHEVAHQELHRPERRPRKVPRWKEELEAWLWSLDTFEHFNLPGVEQARADAARSMGYAISKALRRVRALDKRDRLAREIVRHLPPWLLDEIVPPDDDDTRSKYVPWSHECTLALARDHLRL